MRKNYPLPSQSGNAGKVLVTDGTNPSWGASGGGTGNGNSYEVTVNAGTYTVINQNTSLDVSNTSLDTVWTALLADLGSNPGIIEFGVGTFTTVTGLTFNKNNLIVKGQGQGLTTISANSSSALDSTFFFGCNVSQSSTGYSLTVDANVGDITITISAANLISSGIVAGNYILLSSSLSIDTELSGRNQGELHRVLAVDTGTGIITLGINGSKGGSVYQTMTTANTAKVYKITMYENVTIDGFSFTDTATSRPNTLTKGQTYFTFINNLIIKNCSYHDMFNSGIHIQQTMNTKILNCNFYNVQDVTPSANTYYGVQIRGAAINTSIQNCTGDTMRHFITTGAGSSTYLMGTVRNLVVSGCTSLNTTTAHYDCHQGAEGVSYVNNTMIGDDSSANGIQTRSPITATGNNVVGIKGNAISLFGNAHGSVVTGNVVSGALVGIQFSNGASKAVVSGNTLKGGTRGILMNRTSATVTITIASPGVVTYTSHAITPGTPIVFTTTGALPTGITAGTTYYVIATGMDVNSFQFSATLNGSAVNTSGSQSGTQTLAYTSGDDSLIIGNTIMDNSLYGIDANSQVNVKVSGNLFRANSIPMRMVDTSVRMAGWMITDNKSYNHTSSDNPTVVGSGHLIENNQGFAPATEAPRIRNEVRIRGSGLINEVYPIGSVTSSSIMITQTVYFGLLGLFKGDVINNINVDVSSQGTTSTSVFVGIYDSTGGRLALSNDLTTALDSTGLKSLALSAPYTILADGAYYVAILTISGAPATLVRGSSTTSAFVGVGAGARSFATQSGQATLPTTATLGTTAAFAYWMAVS